MNAIRATVLGRVQGVGFRWSTRHEARRLGLRGWVRNLADGSVEVYAEGDPDSIERFLDWLGAGPAPARVDSVHREALEALGAAGFDIVD